MRQPVHIFCNLFPREINFLAKAAGLGNVYQFSKLLVFELSPLAAIVMRRDSIDALFLCWVIEIYSLANF